MRSPQNRNTPIPVWTNQVLEFLNKSDDFVQLDQLIQGIPGINRDRVSAALHSLQKFKAVEAVEANGKLWWFSTGQDMRRTVIQQRRPEDPGTRRRSKGWSRKKKKEVSTSAESGMT